MRIAIGVTSLALGVLVGACDVAPPATAGLATSAITETDVQAIKDLEARWVNTLLTGDHAAGAAMHTEDAIRLPPNAPAVVGRDAILASLEQSGTVTAVELSSSEIAGAGDIAWAVENFAVSLVPPGSTDTVRETGKGLVIFKRQADGSWLAHRVAWNSSQPAE